MPDLTTSEWMVVLATLAGPILAVQAQMWIERARERRQHKQRLFYTLMGTRAARLSAEHVRALNMLDLEFYGWRLFRQFRWQFPAEKTVIEKWRLYQDHLNEQLGENPSAERLRSWNEKGEELFTDLLHSISYALGFDFDRVQLRRGIYNPRAHGEQELAALGIRDGLLRLLSGQAPLKMEVTSFPVAQEDSQRSRAVQQALLRALVGDEPLKIRIEPRDN